MKKRISIIFLSLLILISCSSIDNLTGPIKIINFNLWHGMNLDSLIMFSEYETPEIRKQRLENFLKAAEKIDPDIITLQECNKLPGIAKKIAKKLNMDEIHKIDNGGVKIFIGPPFNLKSGLTTPVRAQNTSRRLPVRPRQTTTWGQARKKITMILMAS